MFPLRSAMRQRLSPPRRSFRPRVEELEERCVLATFLVNSASLTERVIANPTVTLASSPNPSLLGQPVVFTVSVAAPAAGLPVPTGTVLFTSGGSTLGSAVLSGGRATFTTSALPLGSDVVTASYGGD